MEKPTRIQRSRAKGWKAPAGAVYVGRGKGKYGRWGNPFQWSWDGKEAATEYFRLWITSDNDGGKALRTMARVELRGKDLMCWCALDQPCHADVLLEIANSEAAQ